MADSKVYFFDMSMTKDNIITLPNTHLRERSKKVGIITDQIRDLIADMEAATLDWEASREHEVGVALAAVQIDQLIRIVVVRNNFDDKKDTSFQVFINPEIAKYEGELEEDFEGCLSVKDIYGKVPRYTKVRVKALDENGKPIRLTAEGFLARIFQHEIDHTNGIVFIDHIKDNPKAFYRLGDDGHLNPLDYEKDVANNSILW
ncbi:MAG: peptide deformylase [Candidatus Saccharibacteria bacterium]|nr:peptide deformylase [Candidatus Saccharibacteria bacterium]